MMKRGRNANVGTSMGNCVCTKSRLSKRTKAPEGPKQGQISASFTEVASVVHGRQAIADVDVPLPNMPSAKTIPITLTMSQPHASLPPRPEFIPFTVANLCSSPPWDELDYMTHPERSG
ncbi:hypothetical protein C8Q73DRAFT_522338 [Cubamyces lactineus]|nr:hypothetical protein C8Q73DRAFT_522338 [Cubamyces lactineus]